MLYDDDSACVLRTVWNGEEILKIGLTGSKGYAIICLLSF